MSNNLQLMQLMKEYQLTAADVAGRIAVSPWTVKNWMRPSVSKGFRKVPDMALMALRMSIEQSSPQEQETPTSDGDLPDLEFLPGRYPRR
jgi:hypothetical protein